MEPLTDVKSALGISGIDDDDLLTRLQASADSFIAEYCGRKFEGGTFVEDHPGGARLIFLQQYPVQNLLSVKVDATRNFGDDTQLSSERYFLFAERGVLESSDGTFVPTLAGWNVATDAFPGAVRVTYTTLESAVPPLIRQAYTDLVSHWYRQNQTHQATGQLNVLQVPGGTNGDTLYPWNQSVGYRVPEGILQLLRPFRKIGI